MFMRHGTHHDANATYLILQEKLIEGGHPNYLIGTVEAEPSLEDVMDRVQNLGPTKVLLLPLVIVSGDHARNGRGGDAAGYRATASPASGGAALSGL